VATIAVPVTVQKKFVGLIAVDFDISVFQQSAEDAAAGVAGMRVDLLSHTGTIAASSAGANLFGERLATDQSSAICKAMRTWKA
jgi:hypothetical protein